MTLPTPFSHPTAPHRRRHRPQGYDRYQSYKPWLRDEFAFRCVYCLERERWYPNRADSFSVDHIVPLSHNEDLACQYTNLVYACVRCNAARSDKIVMHPDEVGFGRHLRFTDGALFEPLTSAGRKLIDLLHLNEDPALSMRQRALRILDLRVAFPLDRRVEELFLDTFGYPDDLPDLRALRPPHGNRHASSEAMCYFARREAGNLPSVY